jgi:uncharacterized protein YdhG (YjbR/CyaY superfamily)
MKADSAAPTTIDEYIARFPRDIQEILQKVGAASGRQPGAEEAIKYRIPTFVLRGNLVHFADFETRRNGARARLPHPSGVVRQAHCHRTASRVA